MGGGLSDLLGRADQFFDHLGDLNGPVVVAENGLLQPLCSVRLDSRELDNLDDNRRTSRVRVRGPWERVGDVGQLQ